MLYHVLGVELMGTRSLYFSFTPGENEQIEAIIKLPDESRSILHGIVKNSYNKVIVDAVVNLYECNNAQGKDILKPLTHTFTDECGHFVFGPLTPHKNYAIKLWINDVVTREFIVNVDEYTKQSQPSLEENTYLNDEEFLDKTEDDYEEFELYMQDRKVKEFDDVSEANE